MEKETYEKARKFQLGIKDLQSLKENIDDYVLIPDCAKKAVIKTIEEEIIKLEMEFKKV